MSGEVQRNSDGTFPKGVSGNPAGRPPSKKNKITELKQDLEIAVRENVKPSDIRDIVQKMIQVALGGGKNSVQAAKLILDKTVSNVTDGDDIKSDTGSIRIVIENVTAGRPVINQAVEEAEFTEVDK